MNTKTGQNISAGESRTHDAGPWWIDPSVGNDFPARQWIYCASRLIAEVAGNGYGASGANARLIAAAPECAEFIRSLRSQAVVGQLNAAWVIEQADHLIAAVDGDIDERTEEEASADSQRYMDAQESAHICTCESISVYLDTPCPDCNGISTPEAAPEAAVAPPARPDKVWVVTAPSAYRMGHICFLGTGPTKAAAIEDAFGPRASWGNASRRSFKASDIYEVTADEAEEMQCRSAE